MNTTQQTIDEVNKAINAARDACMIAGGIAYADEADGRLKVEIERWREGTRTLSGKGRAEIAAEDAAEREIVEIAEKAEGSKLVPCGGGDGQKGSIIIYAA